MTNPNAPDRRPLTATYRMQLHAGFTFADAEAVLPYVEALGVSHLYLSPVLTAVPGSEHGYDVLDHTRVSDELGGREHHHQRREVALERGAAAGQAERRLQRAVKAVLARRRGDLGDGARQARDFGVRAGRAGRGVPAEPGRGEIGQRPRLGGVVDRETGKLLHVGSHMPVMSRNDDTGKGRAWAR